MEVQNLVPFVSINFKSWRGAWSRTLSCGEAFNDPSIHSLKVLLWTSRLSEVASVVFTVTTLMNSTPKMQLSLMRNPEDGSFSVSRGIMYVAEHGLEVSTWWVTVHQMAGISGLQK